MKTLRMELILKIGILIFVACMTVGLLNLLLHKKTAQEDMDANVNASAVAFSKAIENAIQVYRTKVESIANESPITHDMPLEEIRALCGDFEKKYGFLDVSFANSKGVPYDDPSLDLSGREYFKHAISGTTYISSPLVSKRIEANSAVVLYIAAKVNNGKYDGITLCELSNDLFSQVIKDARIGNKGYGFMIDKTGTIIAHKDNSLVESFTNYIALGEKDPSYAEMGSFISEMLNKKSGKKSIYFEGSHKYIAYTPVEGPEGWILAMAADEGEMLATYREGIYISLGILALLLFAAGVSAVLIARSIGNPLRKIAEAADKVAVGDLDVNVEVGSKNEIGSLAESFTKLIASTREQAAVIERVADTDLTLEVPARSEKDLMGKKLSKLVSDLNEIIKRIALASEQVASGAKQVSDSSIALSQGATEQASSIEELTASLEEVSSQTKLNAENANDANELAENAKTNALLGNERMQEMLKAIEEINQSSASISKIIKVIDDIAFQTNILALNAAVEAARAGQHGKGFAVVAEEVRNLAVRSANAAKETTDMIESSIKKTEDGTRISKETAEALKIVIGDIEKIAALVKDIATASNEQALGIEQINQGIMQVSQVVQTNSATSEESAAASEELSDQAALLQEMVNKFKLKENIKAYSGTRHLGSEVVDEIEEVPVKKAEKGTRKKTEKEAAAKAKIALSDKELGKY
jgi:methyl-accepting chemotaxis protein